MQSWFNRHMLSGKKCYTDPITYKERLMKYAKQHVLINENESPLIQKNYKKQLVEDLKGCLGAKNLSK